MKESCSVVIRFVSLWVFFSLCILFIDKAINAKEIEGIITICHNAISMLRIRYLVYINDVEVSQYDLGLSQQSTAKKNNKNKVIIGMESSRLKI